MKGLSSEALKLCITAYKVITPSQLLFCVQIPEEGSGDINKLSKFPALTFIRTKSIKVSANEQNKQFSG